MGTSSTTTTSTINPTGIIAQQHDYSLTPVQDVDQPSVGVEGEITHSISNQQPYMHVISTVSSSVSQQQLMPIGAMTVSLVNECHIYLKRR